MTHLPASRSEDPFADPVPFEQLLHGTAAAGSLQ